jgi:hypothetical protein
MTSGLTVASTLASRHGQHPTTLGIRHNGPDAQTDRMDAKSQGQERATPGLCASVAHSPVALIRDTHQSRTEMECPECGHTWVAAPAVKL